MKTRKTLLAALILVPTLRGKEVHAQSLALALVRLGASQTDTAKENALNALLDLGMKEQVPVCSPNASTQIKRALIKALEAENEVILNGARKAGLLNFSESETEYYASVIGCVAALRDPAALRGLGVRQAIIAISYRDSATINLGGGKKGYPVRGAARDWLKQDSLKARKLLPETSR